MEFLRFLKNHYEIILSVLSLIGTLIIFLLKKRPNANFIASVMAELFYILPSFVVAAEEEAFDGVDKRDIVLKACLDFLNKRVANIDFANKELILSKCSDLIEVVLSAPQKKEDL